MSAVSDDVNLDGNRFRRVLGHYPTGVSVVTGTSADGAPVGLAVGSFTSVSLDPPLVAFLPAQSSSSWPKIEAAGTFCVNILAADQEPVCRAFATPGVDKFAGLNWRPAASGAPILDGAVAWIDCSLQAVHEAGDHLIVIGRVQALEIARPTLPLLFFQGGYGKFHAHSLAVRDARFGAQLQLIDQARPLMEELAQRTGAQVLAAYCDGHELVLLASAGSPGDDSLAAAIGQRLPAVAPLGIWWTAWAQPDEVDLWLRHVDSDSRRAEFRRALAAIRALGYCVGRETAQSELGALIARRSDPHAESTLEEQRFVAGLERDPWE